MKLYISKSILTILVFLFLSGCDSFLNVRPSTSNVNPSTIKDFQEMLNSDSLATSSFILADIMSDDAMMVRSDKNEFYGNAYLWNKSIWTEADNDFMYNSAYTRILQLNILLNKAEKVSTGNPADLTAKNIILAQAKVHRAWFYLQLVNLYGNDYTSGSPQTDPAVPLILNPDAGVKPKRATVKEIYDQIIKDLSSAVTTPDLPAMGQTVIHPGRAAAFALLARTYLYMGNYSAALTNANAALDLKNTLADYNALEVIPVSLLDQKDNRETMLAKMGQDVHYINRYTSSMLGSDEVLDLLTYQDQRRNLSFSMYGNNYISVNGIMTFNYSIGVPEVMLIKAECLARKDNTEEALSLINALREKRLNNPEPLTGISTDILKIVLEERRRELFFHGGLRLFDLKRLNRDERFRKTLERTEQYQSTVLSTLEPNSPRYLMEIAPRIIDNNKDIVPNPR